MKRIFIFLSVLCFIRCNEAKSIDIDSAKSPVGVLLNIVLPEILHAGRPAGPEFLAVGENCSLLTSEDGETWTVQQGPPLLFRVVPEELSTESLREMDGGLQWEL